jgi:hypothetical protein
MGRPHPLHAAAFLVDQDEHLVALDRILERCDQVRNLLRGLAVSRKEDEPAGPLLRKERALGIAQR